MQSSAQMPVWTIPEEDEDDNTDLVSFLYLPLQQERCVACCVKQMLEPAFYV